MRIVNGTKSKYGGKMPVDGGTKAWGCVSVKESFAVTIGYSGKTKRAEPDDVSGPARGNTVQTITLL